MVGIHNQRNTIQFQRPLHERYATIRNYFWEVTKNSLFTARWKCKNCQKPVHFSSTKILCKSLCLLCVCILLKIYCGQIFWLLILLMIYTLRYLCFFHFGFLLESPHWLLLAKFWKMLKIYKPFYVCKFSGGDTMRWWRNSKDTICAKDFVWTYCTKRKIGWKNFRI